MIDDAGRRLPTDAPFLADNGPALVVAAFDVDVIVVTGLRIPRAMRARVERPVRDVETLDGVDERRPREAAGREPLAAPPAADVVAHAIAIDAKRQHAFGANRRLDVFIGDERRRAAELAVLADARRAVDHDRPAALALHAAALLGRPAFRGGGITESGIELALADLAHRAID